MFERMESTSNGVDTWQDAFLPEPLPGDDVWCQGRHEIALDGTHEVVVGAMDGEEPLQPEDRWESFPSVATGRVRKTVG